MIAAIGDPSIVVVVVDIVLTNYDGESWQDGLRWLHVPMQLTPDC